MFYDESWKLIYFGVKRSRSWVVTSLVSVFRQNAILPLAAYVSHAGFSLLQCPVTQAMLATPGFRCVTSRSRCCYCGTLTTRGLSERGVFCKRGTNSRCSQRQKHCWHRSLYSCECWPLLVCISIDVFTTERASRGRFWKIQLNIE